MSDTVTAVLFLILVWAAAFSFARTLASVLSD